MLLSKGTGNASIHLGRGFREAFRSDFSDERTVFILCLVFLVPEGREPLGWRISGTGLWLPQLSKGKQGCLSEIRLKGYDATWAITDVLRGSLQYSL